MKTYKQQTRDTQKRMAQQHGSLSTAKRAIAEALRDGSYFNRKAPPPSTATSSKEPAT